MKKYLVAVVLSAVLAIGLLVYGMATAVPAVAAQYQIPGQGVTCTTTCQPDIIINGQVVVRGSCTTVCR